MYWKWWSRAWWARRADDAQGLWSAARRRAVGGWRRAVLAQRLRNTRWKILAGAVALSVASVGTSLAVRGDLKEASAQAAVGTEEAAEEALETVAGAYAAERSDRIELLESEMERADADLDEQVELIDAALSSEQWSEEVGFELLDEVMKPFARRSGAALESYAETFADEREALEAMDWTDAQRPLVEARIAELDAAALEVIEVDLVQPTDEVVADVEAVGFSGRAEPVDGIDDVLGGLGDDDPAQEADVEEPEQAASGSDSEDLEQPAPTASEELPIDRPLGE